MDKHNELGNLSSDIQTREEEVDDSRCEHGCYRAIRESSPPVKFQETGLVEKKVVIWKEKTNTKIKTDAEKSTTNTPGTELEDEPHTGREEDAPYKKTKIDNSSRFCK